MLVSERSTASEEDEMYHVLPMALADQHIAELHREAARQRLVNELRGAKGRVVRRRAVRRHLPFRQPRPAGA
jgi:hypothetical protein